MVKFKKENRKSQTIDRKEAIEQNLDLFRVYAKSVQLPFILVWAKNQEEATDWSQQQPVDEWYEHETRPHFLEDFKAEKIKNVNKIVSEKKKLPKAGA